MKNIVTKRTHKATNIQKVSKEVLAYLFVGLMLVAGCTKLKVLKVNEKYENSDENSDGSVDGGCLCSPGEEKPCGLDEGECKTGIQTCVECQWGECRNTVGKSEEVCDNLDNDCDGETDEVPSRRCGTDVGVCEFGNETCTNGKWNCLLGVKPSVEVCDEQNLDEDCDGVINEDCQCSEGDTLQCGKNEGICYYGKQRCIDGYFSDTCEDEGQPDPRGEICDGAGWDEDCDGKTDIGDEDCDCINGDVEKCEEGLYVCSLGTKTCNNGKWGSCIGVQNGSFEVCNGIDDDCDGITDEAPSFRNSICEVGETCENGRCIYGEVANPYMLSIDTRVSPSRLLKINLATGAGTLVCELPPPFDTYGYNSIAFDTEGQLIMSNYTNYSIDRMDPCTCTVSEVGNTGFTNIPGLVVDGDGTIYGIEMNSSTLLKIDPESGEGTSIGSLGISLRSTGLAWDQHHDLEGYDLYAISGNDNSLYVINSQTGLATLVSEITGVKFSGVGVEIHQTTGELYGCTTDAILYQLNKETGVAIAIGSGMGHSSDCNNLAAPLGPIPCLDHAGANMIIPAKSFAYSQFERKTR